MLFTKVSGGIKRRILGAPPLFLNRRGKKSYILRPRRLEGERYITLGDRVVIHEHAWIAAMDGYGTQKFRPTITIADEVYIGRHVCIMIVGELIIGSGSVLSEHVYISDNSHGFTPGGTRIMDQPLNSKGKVVLGSNSFIGYRAVICPGVELGDWSVVGANSVVTKSFPAYSMVAGAPARLIKSFDHRTGAWIHTE